MPTGNTSGVSHRLDSAALNRILRGPHSAVAYELIRRGQKVEARAKRLCPVDQGRLRNSIRTEIVTQGRALTPMLVRVGAGVHYARWVHDGTGLYGPHQKRIKPLRAKVLVWQTGKGKRKNAVFARSTKGMKGRPFLAKALKEAFKG